jgi:hypothetical protein
MERTPQPAARAYAQYHATPNDFAPLQTFERHWKTSMTVVENPV